MTLQPVETLLAATLVLLLGHLLNRLIPPLGRYNIPAPISGGLLVAIVLALLEQLGALTFPFDSTLKPVLMLSFFAAVGLSADLSQRGKGGKRLVMCMLVLLPFLCLQNALGLLLVVARTSLTLFFSPVGIDASGQRGLAVCGGLGLRGVAEHVELGVHAQLSMN